jgi:hypothetical protein
MQRNKQVSSRLQIKAYLPFLKNFGMGDGTVHYDETVSGASAART